MQNRWIGVLLNNAQYSGIPRGRTRHEAIRFYDQAGQKYGVTPCYFRLQDIRPGQQRIKAYVRDTLGYRLRRIPAPTAIHNRALYHHSSAQRKISALVRGGKLIYNQWNRYGKLHIHELLACVPALRPHLPATKPAHRETIQQMMQEHASLIIKPNSSSIGRGIMKLQRHGSMWELNLPASRSGRRRSRLLFADGARLPASLLQRIRARAYLVQQCLPLATFQGRTFDLRVSVQRGHAGHWQITGMNAKVAQNGVFLTNVAQGANVYSMDILLGDFPHLQPDQVVSDIERFALAVAQQLSRHLPHMADLGLDIGLTREGFPMFIECNGRDLRYSFQEASMPDIWRATYDNPMGYGAYLLKRISRPAFAFGTGGSIPTTAILGCPPAAPSEIGVCSLPDDPCLMINPQ
ncbi:YheC/YheD family endospore coat-associated protein [Paenibacillus sp. y28]|uniref:YheC/YheD family endospore coat-associated protein n=1 Tax=Paenibacillus sp. y28 TaxID=3129110 RepID=UPI003019AA99